MNEVRVGRQESNVLKQVRGWKLFFFDSTVTSAQTSEGRPHSEKEVAREV